MSFLKFLSGPPPEKLEKKGDVFFDTGFWGDAKLEYERALEKAKKERRLSPDWEERLFEKITKSKEALAATHEKSAEDLIEGGYYDEARSLLALAQEITMDEARIRTLTALSEKLEALQQAEVEDSPAEHYYGLADEHLPEEYSEATLDEQFVAICGALPAEIQDIYLSYSEDFRAGYLALNDGDFEAAATFLSEALAAEAMAAESTPGSYIALELATTYLHLGRLAEARELLIPFLEHHPDTLPAYQLLCDICWEEKDFQQADAVIDSVPEDLADSLAVLLLRGETRYYAGDYAAAKALYQTFLDNHGWREEVALALAKAHEASGEHEKARLIYKDIMGRCTSCRTRINPEIKHKYAELSFAAGMHDTNLLELFLSLAHEIPNLAPVYYDRVAAIYSAQGNETEAARFRSIAKRTAG